MYQFKVPDKILMGDNIVASVENVFNLYGKHALIVTGPNVARSTMIASLERTLDNLARHVNVGIELNIKTSLFLRLGYSYRQMVEMKAADRFNTSGFSFGIGFTVKGFQFCYSRNNYHLSQAPNYISVTTSLDRFFR